MILRFYSFANRLSEYKGKLKSFLNEYMGKYVPKEETDIKSQAIMFRQTMQNVWTVFGPNSGRLYSTGTEDRPMIEGKWEPKFSISALDIQASAPDRPKPRQGPNRCRTNPGDVHLLPADSTPGATRHIASARRDRRDQTPLDGVPLSDSKHPRRDRRRTSLFHI